MHKMRKHTLLLLVCLFAVLGTAGMAMAEFMPVGMKVTTPGVLPLKAAITVTIAPGGKPFDVLSCTPPATGMPAAVTEKVQGISGGIALAPDTSGIVETNLSYRWESPAGVIDGAEGPVLTPPVTTPGSTTYTCIITATPDSAKDAASTVEYRASVTINVVVPKFVGPEIVFPGGEDIFTAEVPNASEPGEAVESGYNNYKYNWILVPKDGFKDEDELVGAYNVDGWETQSLTLWVQEASNAWKLTGAKLVCLVQVNNGFGIAYPDTYPAMVRGLGVGVTVRPGSGLAPELVPVDEKSKRGRTLATLELEDVFGGNAPADELKYRWEVRQAPGTWAPVESYFGKEVGYDHLVFQMDVDSTTWSGSTDFRCVVDLCDAIGPYHSPYHGASVTFEARRAENMLVLSKKLIKDPKKPIIVDKQPTESDTVTVTGTILVPANRPVEDETVYTAQVLRKVLVDKKETWVEASEPVTINGPLKPGDTISVTFNPSLYIHEYKLQVSSNVDGAMDERSFKFTVADKNIRVKTLTFPLQDEAGRLNVRYGQPITYVVDPTGGSGRWIVLWKESLTGITIPTDLFDLNKWVEEIRKLQKEGKLGTDFWISLLNNRIMKGMQKSDKTMFTHNIPIQDMPVVATVYAVDHNNKPIMTGPKPTPVYKGDAKKNDEVEEEIDFLDLWDQWATWPCLKADVNSFGTPWVKLEWSLLPRDNAVISLEDLLAGKGEDPEWVGWLRAKGGTTGLLANYWYSIDGGDWTMIRYTLPLSILEQLTELGLPDISTWLAPFGVYFSANSDMFRDYDLEDGRSKRFSIRFKAEDLGGQYVISDPLTLTLLQGTAILGVEGAKWVDEAYAVEYRQGSPKALTAELYGLEEDGISFFWKLPDGDIVEGSAWTPPSSMTPSDEPYVVTLSAKQGAKDLDSVTVAVTVLPNPDALTASAAFDKATVGTGEMAILTIKALSGSGDYKFEAGRSKNDLKEVAATGDTAEWPVFENAADTYTYYWKVTDLGVTPQATREGTARLTVTGDEGDVVKFEIRLPYGTTTKKGTSFEMAIDNSGTRYVKAADLTWSTSDGTIATVNSQGIVSIVGTGDVTITAKLTSDTSVKADCTFTATGDTTQYRVIPPANMTFKAGTPIDETFTTDPAGGTFTCSELPGDLVLSSAGRLTGTAPGAGEYFIESITVTWPGVSKTLENVKITVTRDGKASSDSGGGCDSGFGILALALSAFFALKRK